MSDVSNFAKRLSVVARFGAHMAGSEATEEAKWRGAARKIDIVLRARLGEDIEDAELINKILGDGEPQ